METMKYGIWQLVPHRKKIKKLSIPYLHYSPKYWFFYSYSVTTWSWLIPTILTHCCLVMPYVMNGFRQWLFACLAQSHYLNQCWLVNWTNRNKLQWNFYQNTAFFWQNTFEIIVCHWSFFLGFNELMSAVICEWWNMETMVSPTGYQAISSISP